MTPDELIERLQTRVADPARRVDVPQTELGAAIEGMGLGDMFAMVRDLGADLGRVVEANKAGQPLDPELVDRAERLGKSATEPLDQPLADVADDEALAHAEAALGHPLPTAFRRIYAEVADGGFGPGTGLFSLGTLVETHQGLLATPPTPRGVTWPHEMVPIVEADPGFICLELPSGRIIDHDAERSSEWQSAADFAKTFSQIAPDVEAWLGEWVDAPTPSEQRDADMARLRREELRRTKERIAAMSPAEREAAGLPPEGWEDAFIDEDDR